MKLKSDLKITRFFQYRPEVAVPDGIPASARTGLAGPACSIRDEKRGVTHHMAPYDWAFENDDGWFIVNAMAAAEMFEED